MLAPDLQRVEAELDLWRAAGTEPLFWLRDDDACAITKELERLWSVARRYDVDVALAVIPGLIERDLVGYLRTDAPGFFPMCHGWKHIDHGGPREPGEFGASRPLARAREDALRAFETFREHFPEIPAVFVPPFGRISEAMIAALPGIGFAALSGGQRPIERRAARLVGRLAWAPALNLTRPQPLPRIDAHIDLIDWRAQSAEDVGAVADRLVGQLRLRRKGFVAMRSPIGLLTHHRVHDEKIWQLLETLLDFLARRRDITFIAVASTLPSLRRAAAAADPSLAAH